MLSYSAIVRIISSAIRDDWRSHVVLFFNVENGKILYHHNKEGDTFSYIQFLCNRLLSSSYYRCCGISEFEIVVIR